MKILFLLLLLPVLAFADTATITFIAPTEREDNTPLAPDEIAGFNVYDVTGEIMQQLPADAREFDVITTSATQSLFVTTVDTGDRESVYSQEVSIPATIASPKPPGGIDVFITR